MIGYLKLFQLVEPPLHKNTHPDVNFLSSGSDIKSKLVYPSTHNSNPPSKIKNKFLVLFKYLRIFFTIIQCSSSGFNWYLFVTLTVRATLDHVHNMAYIRLLQGILLMHWISSDMLRYIFLERWIPCLRDKSLLLELPMLNLFSISSIYIFYERSSILLDLSL